MGRDYTKAQLRAIESKAKRLLVCAAAGSGKTTVLAERILRYVSNPDTPGSLSRLIVVTFTRAAAAELRDRICTQLESELERNPTEHLTHEILAIAGARISTIHSFCYDLIRAEGEKLGISRNVRLVDDLENKRLMLDTMEAVLRDRCKTSKKFSALTESLVGYRKDSLLSKFLIELYEKLVNLPESVEFIKKCAEDERLAAEDDFLHSACGTKLAFTLKKKLSEYITLTESCLDTLPADHNFTPKISAEKENLKAFMLSLDTSYKDARDAYKNACEFASFRSSAKFSDYKSEENTTKYVRDNYKAFLKRLDPVFAQTENEARESALEHSELLFELYHTLKQFDSAIFEAKKQAEICSFTDLEQLSIKLLYDENGNLTDLARSVSACFDCVFIDEYQDVNNTQRMIFDAISSSCKCFRVGDIKQSIYAFRGADPSIIDKLRAKYDADGTDDTENVFMSNNFRSKKEILDYINVLFEPHFRGGDFSYEDGDMLIGLESDKPTDDIPRVTVIACKNGKIKDNTVSVSEADAVASEIERLVRDEHLCDGKRITYSDISILLRNYSSHNEAFVRAFKKRGIPYSLQGKRKVFNEVHVRYFLSVLQCADNPTKDIPLATVLFSSLMRFDENDLLTVQRLGKESLWKNLSVAAEVLGGKFKEAHERISRWRAIARRSSCDSFVRYLLNDEGIRSLLINEARSDTEKTNVAFDLDIIYSRSLAFKNEPMADFSAFVEQIEELAETNADIEASASKSKDAVSIMSAHASKGLEFPVCFVSRCNANRKHADESRITFNTDVGVGMYLTDPRGFVLVNTPTREAIKLINEEKDAGEEQRILYVEFTRAKERLYITADSIPEDVFSDAEAEGALSGTHFPWQMNPIRASIRAAISNSTKAKLITVNPKDRDAETEDFTEAETEQEFDSALACKLAATLGERLSFEYPESYVSRIPAKISVSKLSPSVLDEAISSASEEEELSAIGRHKSPEFKDAPEFLCADKKPTAAEAGTATHLFLQFCDIENARKDGVPAEADRLLTLGFIGERERSLLSIDELETFINSSFASQIQNAELVRREFRFNCFMPADKLTASDELRKELSGMEIAVQGVIDGFFIDGEDIILFDYKTDRVKSTDDAERIFTERYSWQISCYAEALRRIFGKKVKCAYIYSTALGREIPIPCDLIYG